ncbi:hypothetical protein CEE69_30690 [Rhodopirellula bahusiensis]|uniref:Uncharacterized protein n=1 Tax=Rhodopirellula bahusiensis TaxID=2014065 RepID=A0A2G1VXM3_9BACT|nr:hypothetical protein CEE69_30690 [Rhodopirellula bahusiensis]
MHELTKLNPYSVSTQASAEKDVLANCETLPPSSFLLCGKSVRNAICVIACSLWRRLVRKSRRQPLF